MISSDKAGVQFPDSESILLHSCHPMACANSFLFLELI
jgi:hypothetical protein